MTKFVRWEVMIGQGCSWEVTTNDEIGDATIKVSVMMLIMMIMMIMMMMVMVMLVMMLEMLVMAVVTVCYAFTHSLGHTTGKVGDTWCVENDTFDENGAYFYFFSTVQQCFVKRRLFCLPSTVTYQAKTPEMFPFEENFTWKCWCFSDLRARGHKFRWKDLANDVLFIFLSTTYNVMF